MKKNLLLSFIYVFTVLVVLYFCKLYKSSNSYEGSSNRNDITSSNYNILYDNVYNYSLEHSTFKIYFSDKYDSNVVGENLFVDITRARSKNVQKLLNDFGYSYKIANSSFCAMFEDSIIVSVGDCGD